MAYSLYQQYEQQGLTPPKLRRRTLAHNPKPTQSYAPVRKTKVATKGAKDEKK